MALTVIRGLADAGKSVAVEDWAASQFAAGLAVVRVPEVARGQREESFWRTVGSALGIGAASGQSTMEYVAVCEFLESAERDIALVLDHPDRVVDAGFEERILALLRRCHGVHIIASVRSTRLFADCASGDVDYREIGPEDLRFTAVEARELWCQAGIDLPMPLAEQLHRGLGGVPLLIREVTPAIWQFASFAREPDAAWRALHRALSDWVDRGLRSSHASPSAWAVAVVAAVHGVVNPELAAAVGVGEFLAEPSEAMGVLNVLYQPSPRAAGGWRLVPGMRALALQRIRAEPPPGALATVAALAAHLAETGDVAGALRCGLATDDWEPIWPILRDNWATLVVTQMSLVSEVLIRLPDNLAILDHSAMAGRNLYTGLDLDPIDVLAGGSLAGVALLDPAELRLPFPDIAQLVTVQSVSRRIGGDFTGSSEVVARISEMHEEASAADQAAVASYLPLMRVQWATNHQLADNLALADMELRRAYASGAAIDYVVKYAVGSLAMHEVLRGEIGRANEWLKVEARHGDGPDRLGPQFRIPGQVTRVLVALDELDLAGAETILDLLGEPDGTEQQWAAITHAHARFAHAAGDAEIGLDRVLRALAVYSRWAPAGSFAVRAMKVEAATLYTSLGRGNDALAALEGAPADHPTVRLCRARVLMLSGDLPAAMAEIADSDWGENSWYGPALEARLLAAAGHALAGELEAARGDVSRAYAMSRLTGSLRPLLSLPRRYRGMLLSAGLPGKELARIWQAHEDMQPYPDEVKLVILSPRELEVVQRLVMGSSQKVIAEELFVSVNTIKTQLQSIYRKLEVQGRVDAVRVARRLRLV